MRLLIIADDFTGALDTGVQFAIKGVSTCVVTDPGFAMEKASPDTTVLVLDAETRHISAKEAYNVVHRAVKDALDSGFTYIYKKTDSALRGNVGAELKAVMDAAGCDRMPFLPAFPQMNRTTVDGVHLIDGVPVAESVFGKDPFEPVRDSSVSDIIHSGADVSVVLHPLDSPALMTKPGIHVYDAVSQNDLKQWGEGLSEDGIHISAGCAGFAAVASDMLIKDCKKPSKTELKPGLFVACGSVNEVTIKQMEEAEKAGFTHIHLNPVQKLDENWVNSDAKKTDIKNWLELTKKGPFILDVNDPKGCHDTENYSKEHGLSVEYRRERISENLAILVKDLLDVGLSETILCTGGDTLLALMNKVGVSELIPVKEMASGAVLTNFKYNGKVYNIISKSGGFGEPDLFIKVAK